MLSECVMTVVFLLFVPHLALAQIAGFTVTNTGLDVLPSDSWGLQDPRGHSEFISLLTVVGDAGDVTSSAVASARMSLHGTSLTYCVTVEGLTSAKKLQILDKNGVLLHETGIKIRKKDTTVCGDWSRLADPYIQWLHHQDLRLRITTRKRDVSLSGDIRSHILAHEVTLAGVLRPSQADGTGALVMASADESHRSIDFTVLFSGLQKEDLTEPCDVTFAKGRSVLYSTKINFADKGDEVSGYWINLPKRMVKYAPRGKISFSVATSSGRAFSGDIQHSANFKVLHSFLHRQSSLPDHVTATSGAAVFEIRPSGILKYDIQITGVPQGDVMADMYAVNAEGVSESPFCRVAQFVDSLPTEESTMRLTGSCRRLNLWDLHLILTGRVKVKVTHSESRAWSMMGSVTSHFRGGIQNVANPVLLSGSSSSPPRDVAGVGLAWFHVDSSCMLRYDVIVEAGDGDSELTSTIAYMDRRMKQKSVALSRFGDKWSRGFINVTRNLARTLSRGDARILVTSLLHPNDRLSSKITIPNTCLKTNAMSSDAPRPKKPTNFMLQDQGHVNGLAAVEIGHNCLVLGIMRKNGETWIPEHNMCQTCSCNLGEYVCHDIVCPAVTCSNPQSVPGDCCLQCVEESDLDQQCFFDGDLRFHSYGTRWHPYMPTSGYSTCAVCECRGNEDNGVSCGRLACPVLTCHPTMALRLAPNDCCQVCPEGVTDPPMLMEEAPEEEESLGVLDTVGSCSHQGVIYSNGETWNPVILPFGEEPCITCRCLFGHMSCERETCAPLVCDQAIILQGQCCPVCEATRVEPAFSSIGGALD